MFFSSKKSVFNPSDISGPLEKMSFDASTLPSINNFPQPEMVEQSYKERWIRSHVISRIIDVHKNYLDALTFHLKVLKPALLEYSEQIEYNIDEHQVRVLYANMDTLYEIETKIRMKLAAVETNLNESCNLGSYFFNMKDQLRNNEGYFQEIEKILKVSDHCERTSLKKEIERFKYQVTVNDASVARDGFLRFILFQPMYHVCNMSVLLKILAVFTPYTHADARDIIHAYQVYQSLVVKISPSYIKTFLEEAYKICDDLQNHWDTIGASNKSGFATKRGGSVKTWKIRWFTMKGNELKYYEEPAADKPLATLDLNNCKKVYPDSSQEKEHCIAMEFKDRTYYIYFTSINEKNEWMNALQWKVFLRKDPCKRAQQSINLMSQGAFPNTISLIT